MKDHIKAAVLASFAGDALALGVHWIYNTRVIDRKYGRVENMIAPTLAKFHKGRTKGAFTHYGDQTLTLLQSVACEGAFDPHRFSLAWRNQFATYDGYFDTATKETLAGLKMEKDPMDAGAASSDLGGAARIAPLLLCYGASLEALIHAARVQTSLTHNNPDVIAAAEFFARSAHRVLQGERPTAALKAAARDTNKAFIGDALATAMDSRDFDTRPAVLDFGQMCAVEAALPATLHLVVKYEDDLKTGLVENIMAGGDSAARGLLAGMLLGAFHGVEAIPWQWLQDMQHYQMVVNLVQQALH